MPMTMYEIAFPVTINIGAWAGGYVRQIGQIAKRLFLAASDEDITHTP